MESISFSFYGIILQLKSRDNGLIRDIKRDFSFFACPATQPKISINAYLQEPPYGTLPAMQASYVSPRNICYYHQGIKYIDYSGKGLVIYDKKKLQCDIYSAEYPLLHEACYMAILSLANEHLDKIHIHRVHGLGLQLKDNKAVLLLLDMGGGKTTLALQLLSAAKEVKLISEDSPLINKKGEILPFPLRIGVNPQEKPKDIPAEHIRYFERQEFGPKALIDIDYFKGKIADKPSQPDIIILGRRALGQKPQIRPASKYAALKEFIKNCVIGLGLFQGVEYIFQKGPKEAFFKIPIALSRLNNTRKVIKKSRIFEFLLSCDVNENNRILQEFIF